MFKKSQAALEFLTTYAWAFLVILIMVGALAYFGILSPSNLLPDRCNFGSEIGCEDFRITLTTMNLRLKNNVGEAIVIPDPDGTSISESTESTSAIGCTVTTIVDSDGNSAPLTSAFTWNTGELIDITWGSCDGAGVGFVAGEKGKVAITIDYHLAKTGPTYTHQIAGEVFATVT